MFYHHIYNRGAHREQIFRDKSDYWRMLYTLYLANNSESFHFDKLLEKDIFESCRKENLVDIVAYCLMPNHIHIALRSKSDLQNDPGISKFMQKLCTGYTMYFNLKYDHSGTIWQGVYKKKIADDEMNYMRILINYIHLNPYGIKEPEMTKEARKEHPQEAWSYSLNYEYSSLKDYLGEVSPRPQKPILCEKEVDKWR
jgi:putative transposase